jgi:hypothetical protein
MGYYADKKDYYESETQRRVLHIPNLSLFLSKLNDQVLKLPHEIVDNSVARPTGYVMVAPARLMLATEEAKPREFNPDDVPDYKTLGEFDKAMKKLEWIYILLEEADWLNDRLISESLPDDKDTYESGGSNDETDDAGAMPPPIEPPNDQALGPVEKENPQSVA